MADKAPDNPNDPAEESLDLNSLAGLSFGPDWADDTKRQRREPRHGEGRSSGPRSRPPRSGSRDRRPPQGDRRRESGAGPSDRRDRKPAHREAFHPTVAVDLYPQDEAFDALVNRLRATARTYQLFEIAHLLLEKPERFVAVVTNKPKSGEAEKPLFFSVPGHLPFETEDEAVNFVIANHMDRFFDIEEIEVDPPSGNFQMVNRCTVTDTLLGPPNYHRYQDFLQQHYTNHIRGMSFDRFQEKIETVKEQESIDAWVESMKKGHRYTLKLEDGETEAKTFDTLEAAKSFLLHNRKDQVVQSAESVRFAGRDIERLPKGNIRRSVEFYVEHQRQFPLDTANNIRGRLRRHKFTVYKKGSKGVSYVCAVKRKFREGESVFTDSIQGLIEFIEKHPGVAASKLPGMYLGIETKKQRPEELKVTDAEVAEAAEQRNAPTEGESAEAPAEAPEAGVAEGATASTEATPKGELSADEQKRLDQLMLDLKWLIFEGYVTEYGDGTLFAPEPLPSPKKKEDAPDAEPEAQAEPEAEAEPEAQAEPEAKPEVKEEAPEKVEVGSDEAVVAAEVNPPVAEAPAAEAPVKDDAPAEEEKKAEAEASPEPVNETDPEAKKA